MTMRGNNTLITVAILILLFLFVGFKYKSIIKEYIPSDTVTITKTKTDTVYTNTLIRDTVPKLKYIKIVKRDTVYNDNGDTIPLITENKIYQDTITDKCDTAVVTNYITGINARLDSTFIKLNRREITKTIYQENTVYLQKKKTLRDRIIFGPTVSSGYDVINKNFSITTGFGMTLDLW